ncbi:MAG: DUF3275 family protein [Ottowia sp.]|jgi:hypothetical protein
MITAENALLRIKRIRQSRNGAFCVADLITDFGEFKVKDPILEQFEEGEYEATVWISEIHLGQYIAYGKAVTEMRARLQDLQVHTEEHCFVKQEVLEPDPMDEPVPIKVHAYSEAALPACQEIASQRDARWDEFRKPKAGSAQSETVKASTPLARQLESLYDEDLLAAIEKGGPVKLDPSVNRARLRQQTADLKARGYRFDSRTQTFIK